MRLADARRLTGPNLLSRSPLSIVELECDPGEDPESIAYLWMAELNQMRAALAGHADPVEWIARKHARGVICGFAEPIDVLLAATEASEWAALSAVELKAGRPPLPIEPKRTEIETMLTAQRRPRVLALQVEAKRRGLPFLWDDEEISIGAGARMRRWSWADAPNAADVPWSELGTIPIALITGTNGKTTCSRLLARVAREAGLIAGSTSTQGIVIDGKVVAEGDQTGPAAARTVLRDPSVQLAVLETARGGIMRRGLAVESADAALITNVGADHLGHFGIDDVHAMARVKAVVGSVVKPFGRVVINALDPELVALADTFPAPVTYFSSDQNGPALVNAKEAWVARDGWICHGQERVLPIADAPITFGGTATYNVENVLAVAALSSALGLPQDALIRALRGFCAADNPGRGQLLDVGGVKVLLDFGHNADGVRAVLQFVAKKRNSGRLAVITGTAGDRRDDEIRAVTEAIVEASPDLVIVRELADYLRGRQPGEVPERMRQDFASLGVRSELATDEVAALRVALDWARPGDFIALLVHVDDEGTHALLRDYKPIAK